MAARSGSGRQRAGIDTRIGSGQYPDIVTVLAQPAPVAAPRLLGWLIRVPGITARITEVEAYHGEADRACHASRGRTQRTEVLYGPAGTLYVYRCYGVHWMLNLVCGSRDVPSAVLVRSVEIISSDELVRVRRGMTSQRHRRSDSRLLANGPGKVCQALGISGREHGRHLHDRQLIVSLSPPEQQVSAPCSGRRVGVAYAGRFWAQRQWRWWVRDFPVARHLG